MRQVTPMNQISTQADWGKLKDFYFTAQAGSFTKACGDLGITQSAVSRSIQSLEESLGYPLFIRNSHGLTLTEQGRVLLDLTAEIMKAAQRADVELANCAGQPQGVLRVAPIAGVFPLYLAPHIPEFLERYPQIRLSILSQDKAPDLNRLEVDVLIHPFIEERPELVQRLLMRLHLALYASPAYLERHGTPTCAADLDDHRLIASGDYRHHPFRQANWLLSVGRTLVPPGRHRKKSPVRTPYFEENTSLGRMALAKVGLGIVTLAKEQPGLAESGLVPILPDLTGPSLDFYYTTTEMLQTAKRVEVLWEYLADCFRPTLDGDAPCSDQ